MTSKPTVVVGMSGGVDSSVTALLLKEQGYDVIGLFMKNWNDDSPHCKAAEDYQDVVTVCSQIGIPYYTVNFAKEYWDRVFNTFLEGLRQGLTPNPDVLCNREIKFDCLLEKALEIGGDCLATGHYCQIKTLHEKPALFRGQDPGKDQSYFLHAVSGQQLEKALFPLGAMEKSTVRKIAAQHGIATSQKKDSTGICFIGKRNFKEFLKPYIAYQEGEFQTLDGRPVGKHDGFAYYTLGQRKGLGIGGPGEAWFVVGKDIERNIVYVVQGESHPTLYRKELKVKNPHWISGEAPQFPFRCAAQIRYRQTAAECVINADLRVTFDKPQKAATPQQSIVFYDGDHCLGGGLIDCPLLPERNL